jgi:hypothetical protein
MLLIEICKELSCLICETPEVHFQDQEDKDCFYCDDCARRNEIPDNSNESLTNEERNK